MSLHFSQCIKVKNVGVENKRGGNNVASQKITEPFSAGLIDTMWQGLLGTPCRIFFNCNPGSTRKTSLFRREDLHPVSKAKWIGKTKNTLLSPLPLNHLWLLKNLNEKTRENKDCSNQKIRRYKQHDRGDFKQSNHQYYHRRARRDGTIDSVCVTAECLLRSWIRYLRQLVHHDVRSNTSPDNTIQWVNTKHINFYSPSEEIQTEQNGAMSRRLWL